MCDLKVRQADKWTGNKKLDFFFSNLFTESLLNLKTRSYLSFYLSAIKYLGDGQNLSRAAQGLCQRQHEGYKTKLRLTDNKKSKTYRKFTCITASIAATQVQALVPWGQLLQSLASPGVTVLCSH